MLIAGKLTQGQDFVALPIISALLMALGRGATLGDVARLMKSR